MAFLWIGGLAVFFFVPRVSSAIEAFRVWAWVAVGLLAVLGLYYMLVLPRLTWRRSSWRLQEHGLQIRKGVLWRHVLDVPRARVQHTDVVSGPLLRRHGLAKLVVYTAGTRFAEVELAGIGESDAHRLRDSLMAEVSQVDREGVQDGTASAACGDAEHEEA